MKIQKSIYRSPKGKVCILEYYNQLLKDWPRFIQEHNLSTSYGNTFVMESGNKSKPAIVLLHGSGSNSAMWKGDVEKLADDFHVFAIDIIGECGKSGETRPKFNYFHYSEWLKQVFDKLNIPKATIIGCSLGGWLATNFTIRYPQKVERLILLATAGFTPVKIKSVLWIIITSMFGKWGFKQLNKMVYGNLKIDQTALEFAGLIKQHYVPRTDIIPVFNDDDLKKITQPVLFIGGENDCFYYSQKTASRIAELTKKGQSKILDGTGHVIINQTSRMIKFINETTMEV